MKQSVLLLAITIFLAQDVHGQILAVAPQSIEPAYTTYTAANFTFYREQRRLGALTIAGGIAAAAGLVTTVIGAVVYWADGLNESGPNQQYGQGNDYNQGIIILQVGGGLSLVGVVVCIVGAVRDHNQSSRRWGVIAPKPNQVGLAYNF